MPKKKKLLKMCSVRKKAKMMMMEKRVDLNPLDLPEIIEKICTFLHTTDLKRCQGVNRTWFKVSMRELHLRKPAYASFRWLNSSEQRHEWFNRCGNVTLYHHAQTGALDAIKEWNAETLICTNKNADQKDDDDDDQYFTLLFTTGAVYVQYMVANDLAFVLISELYAAAEVKRIIKSSLLFLSTLKLITCEDCAPGMRLKRRKVLPHSDLMVLKMPKLPNLHPFQSTLDVEYPEESEDEEMLESSVWRQRHLDLFRAVTGIDPEVQKIKAIVVLNAKDLIHVFRSVWQDYGPFPLIGCDSEGLVNYLHQKDLFVKKEELNSTTCGIVIVEDPETPLKCASVVLKVNDDYEKKINDLQSAGFVPNKSWGIALSSCLRGYDGDDITNEIIEGKDEIQKRECQLFHSIVGKNYVGAEVEDVFGTNQILEAVQKTEETHCDKESSPDSGSIYFNDSATVFLVVGQK